MDTKKTILSGFLAWEVYTHEVLALGAWYISFVHGGGEVVLPVSKKNMP